jgi:hypothetical protein
MPFYIFSVIGKENSMNSFFFPPNIFCPAYINASAVSSDNRHVSVHCCHGTLPSWHFLYVRLTSFPNPDTNYFWPFGFFMWFPLPNHFPLYSSSHTVTVMLQTYSLRFSSTRITTHKIPFLLIILHPPTSTLKDIFPVAVYLYIWSFLYTEYFFIAGLLAVERTTLLLRGDWWRLTHGSPQCGD